MFKPSSKKIKEGIWYAYKASLANTSLTSTNFVLNE